MRAYNLKLNPQKCAFGVDLGKFLGFLLTHLGIEANLEKVKVIEDMCSPQTLKEVQQLTGGLVAFNHLWAKVGDKCLPFFNNLKVGKDFA